MKLKPLSIFIATAILTSCSSTHSPSGITTGVVMGDETRLANRQINIEEKIDKLISQMTLEEKISLTHANSKFAVASIERLGIHETWMSDGPHGVRHEIQRHSWDGANWTDDQSTYLPHLTSVAASWDRDIAALHGNVLGSEARHRRKDFILGPGVNLARLPLYGRNFEYMGEDPILAAKLAVPQIKAIQNNDVAATIKHYALNTQELNRIGVNAKPDERTLREVYLPAFEAAVKEANVQGIMGAYNEFRGTNANQSEHLVKNILKGEWGYKGVLLTDWNVDINTYDAAVNGLDIEMGTGVDTYDEYFLAKPFQKMIEEGKIPVSVLDDKVRRVLRVQFSIGMMDKYRISGERNTKAHQQAARKIATEGIVLLKNEEQLLPLDQSKLKNILVLGPNADKKHGRGGGSSEVYSQYEVTPLEGIKAQLGNDVNITVMRVRSSNLTPIAADYIATRHWTGTPAWNMNFYSDSKRTKSITNTAIPNAQYHSPDASVTEYITMTADVKPLKSGVHKLKASAPGKFTVSVNGKQVMSHQGNSKEIFTTEVSLEQGKTYQFEINYDGNDEFTLGWDAPGNLFSSEKTYLEAAKKADAVIYVGGLSHADDREAIDRINMVLPNSQSEIIDKLLSVNDNTVVLMVAGSAVEMPWVDKAKALIWGWYGGMEAGHAFADVIFGDVNPSGKMPITLPKKLEDTAPIKLNDYNAVESLYTEGVFIGYRWFEQQNIKPSFPFGYGLSYTSFDYSDIKLSNSDFNGDGSITVTGMVTNTGDVAGAEVVQLYIHDKESSVDRPAKELKDFDKVFLEPGESKPVTMSLNKRDLSFWDVKSNDWLAEDGEFEVLLGTSVEDIRLKASFSYSNN